VSAVPNLDPNKYVAVLRRWWWLLALATALAAALSVLVSLQMPKTYMTSLDLLVGDDTANPNPSMDDVTVSQRLAGVYAGMVTREPILSATVSALNLPTTWWQLQQHVLVSRPDGSQIVEIRVTDTDPARAKATVDELAHQLALQSPTAENAEELNRRRDFVQQQLERLQANIQDAEHSLAEKQATLATATSARAVLDVQDEIKALELNLTNWRASYASILATNITKSPNTLTVIQPAVVPTRPTGPNIPANVLAGALLGLMVAYAGALFVDFLRGDRVNSPDDVGPSLGLTVLGTIGRMKKTGRAQDAVVVARSPRSTFAEDFRRMRTNLQFCWANSDEPFKLLITSAAPGEGKSVVSANIAAAFALAGKRTVLLDADVRRPTLHTLFGVSNDTGLTSLFWGGDLGDAPDFAPAAAGDLHSVLLNRLDALLVSTSVPGLRLLPGGPRLGDESGDLLPFEDMQVLLEVLDDLADVVIIDTPPVLAAAEVARLASLGPGVVLVVEAGQTPARALRFMQDALDRARARVLGVVLNKAAISRIPYYTYYRESVDPKHQRARQRVSAEMVRA
jgi:Mrp family chromosome partitioning ATPase/capsular polysaccharide biosynthesis protein